MNFCENEADTKNFGDISFAVFIFHMIEKANNKTSMVFQFSLYNFEKKKPKKFVVPPTFAFPLKLGLSIQNFFYTASTNFFLIFWKVIC